MENLLKNFTDDQLKAELHRRSKVRSSSRIKVQ